MSVDDSLTKAAVSSSLSVEGSPGRTFDGDGYCRRAGVIAYCTDPAIYSNCPSTGAGCCLMPPISGSAPCVNASEEPPNGSNAELRVLLVASSRRKGCWILPGGGIDPGESEAEAAVREAHEEAGVIADAGAEGSVRYLATVDNVEKRTRTRLFVLKVASLKADGYEDHGRRQRAWATLEQARHLLSALPAQAAYYEAAMRTLGWTQA